METASTKQLAMAADAVHPELGGASSTISAIKAAASPSPPGNAEILAMLKALQEVAALRSSRGRDRTRPRSRSGFRRRSISRSGNRQHTAEPNPSGHCYYHETYGAEAFKCRQPCSFQKN